MMVRMLLIFVFLARGSDCFAQAEKPEQLPESTIYCFVGQPKPVYDLNEYLNKNLHYPDSARDKNIQGRIVPRFMVNEDGSVTNCEVVRGIGGGCDEEALRVVRNFPKWIPAKQNGKPVKMTFMLPIIFALN
jgi:TonB family protein